jgi:Xaa-Pro aminopeptidase
MEPNPLYDRQFPTYSFSLAERDRRWGHVRSLMDAAGIDILIAPTEADSRYLSQMAYDIGPTILPMVGDVTAITNQGRVGSAAQSWVSDIRRFNRRWTDGIVDRLSELDADRKIIGVVGLDGFMRKPDGDLNYQTLIYLREAFSHARWVGATQLMQEARYVKSDEEIDVLRTAAAAADAGLMGAIEHFHPGVTDRELWGQMTLAMLRAGADPPQFAHLGVASLDDVRGFGVLPVGRRVQSQEILYTEVEGRFAGYAAQGVQPAIIGSVPREWLDAWEVARDAWQRSWDVLRAGVPLREVAQAAVGAATGRFHARQSLHGQGLGDDMPLVSSNSSALNRMADRTLEVGACFVLKPYATWNGEHGPKELNWGDTVAITPTGPVRLGSRPQELIIRA